MTAVRMLEHATSNVRIYGRTLAAELALSVKDWRPVSDMVMVQGFDGVDGGGEYEERWGYDEGCWRETRRVLSSTGSGGRKRDRGWSRWIVNPSMTFEWMGRHRLEESVADVRISGTEALETRRVRGESLSIF